MTWNGPHPVHDGGYEYNYPQDPRTRARVMANVLSKDLADAMVEFEVLCSDEDPTDVDADPDDLLYDLRTIQAQITELWEIVGWIDAEYDNFTAPDGDRE